MTSNADFRFLRREESLFSGSNALAGEDGQIWAPLDAVASASLSSLRRACMDQHAYFGGGSDGRDLWNRPSTVTDLRVSRVPIEEFDEEYSVFEDASLGVLATGQVVLDLLLGLHGTDLDESQLHSLLEPRLQRAGADFLGAEIEGSGTQAYTQIRVGLNRRGGTVASAFELAADLQALVERIRHGDFDAQAALDLLLAGRADLLVGLPESEWLEVKSQGYALGVDADKIELAQDVARFANGSDAGLLVLGLQTGRRSGLEVITKASPALVPFDVARHHKVIDARVFPPVQGLRVVAVEMALGKGRTGHLLAIYLPAQPEEMKPFLVHGAVVGGKVEGAFISIVQRRGEHSIPVTGPAIHAALAAGRALLRGSSRDPSESG